MGNRVTFIYEAIDRFTKVGVKINKNVKEQTKSISALKKKIDKNTKATQLSSLEFIAMAGRATSAGKAVVSSTNKQTRAIGKLQRKIKQTGEAAKKTNKELMRMARTTAEVGKEISLKLTLPIGLLGSAALIQSANFETLAVSISSLVGSTKLGAKLFLDLRKLAAETPFQLQEIAEASKRLLAFGEDASTVTDTIRRLGDLAAASGKPLNEFALVFGQIRAKGKLTGEETMQLAEKGVSIMAELLKTFPGVTRDQLLKAQAAGQIPFSAVEKALKRMTNEGGKFFNMTKTLSQTLFGRFSTFKDAIAELLGVLGDVIVDQFALKELLKDSAAFVVRMAKGLKEFAKSNPGWTKFFLILTGIVAIAGPLLFMFGQLAISVIAIKIAFAILAPMFVAAGAALLAMIPMMISFAVAAFGMIVPMLPLIAVIIAVGAAFIGLIKLGKFVTDNWDMIIAKFKELTSLITNFDFEGIKAFFGFGADIVTSNTSQTSIDVTLKAPPNTIEKVKTNTTGNIPGLNLGLNMVLGL